MKTARTNGDKAMIRRLLPTVQEMFTAQAKLKAAGWTHTGTLMHDGGDSDGEYGLRYERVAERFWLNKDTINDLPE